MFNSLGVDYIPDTSTYKHGFKVPYDGIYRIDIVMQFREKRFYSAMGLFCLETYKKQY